MTGSYSRKPLRSYQGVSQSPAQGGFSVLFGVPFVLAGGFILLIAGKVIPVSPGEVKAPMWVLGAVGASFALAGAVLMIKGAIDLSRARRIEKQKSLNPREPWCWDYPWNPAGIQENKQKKVFRQFLAAGFLLIFLVPLNWWAWGLPEAPGMVRVIVSLFDFAALLVLGYAFYLLFQYRKYGNGRLRFQSFPFFLGEKARMVLEGLPEGLDHLHLTLRFIEEAYETRYRGRDRSTQVVFYLRYLEERTLNGASLPRGGELALEWDLPPDKEFVSRLGERPAWYWELTARAETPGIDYEARFFLPVYARP